jgi:two-component system aerobic respiration control sensor histidine kinase ArcB
MSFKVQLATERQRRKEAEAQVARLQLLLEHLTQPAGQAHGTAQSLAQPGEQLKQTELKPEEEQDLMRQVIDSSPNLVYVKDLTGKHVLANKRYRQLLDQHVAVEKLSDALVVPAPESAAYAPPTATTAYEEHYQLKDGQTLVYRTTQKPLVRSDGTHYLLTFSSDITDLKQAHRLANDLVQTEQLFMANMSHEIRTPLHGIMGLAEMLRKGELSTEQADYLEMILYNTENLLTIVNDILDFSKIKSGQISLESISFDLLKVVQHAANSFAFKIAEKGLHLHIESPSAGLPLLLGDPHRLHQVLVNLISNAIKFTTHGTITITITLDTSTQAPDKVAVGISIEDTGIGISAADVGHIFNRFEQANPSITRLYGGTGLGLTICKNLVELQGGHIGVRSELGQGSCFQFFIPYVLSDEQPTSNLEDLAFRPPADLLQGLTVLLVEDNAVNQLIAVSMLGQWQVAVDIAHNGEEALQKAFQRAYDLILMDIQMPQLDGLTATAKLRQEPNPNQHTPIVAMTADAVRIYANACQQQGFTDSLIKPYSESALYKLLARVSQRGLGQAPPVEAAQAPPLAASGLHYDFLQLGRLATDEKFIVKMLQTFVARVPAQVQLLQEAATRRNWSVASREAHTLKTTFGSLNIQPTTEHLKSLEALLETGIPPAADAQALVGAIAQDAQQLAALFTQRLAHS